MIYISYRDACFQTRLAEFAENATKCLLIVLKQNLTKVEKETKDGNLDVGILKEQTEPEKIVSDLMVSFMNSNNLAVDFKSKQTNSYKTAGEGSSTSKITKVSKLAKYSC